ncbi:YIP1 family protein [Candidatus Woesearchaeota archaeon]|nr:YIP1 family protein [Candidatus Woesearchaeota archaeon]
MNLFQKIGAIVTKPKEFFSQVKQEKGIGPAFGYYAVVSLMFTILGMLMAVLTTSMMMGLFGMMSRSMWMYWSGMAITPIFIIFMGIFGYIVKLIGSFIYAGILHLWILIFGGKAEYTETYKLAVYAQTPKLLLGWIPFVSFIIWIWDILLLIIGTQAVHGVSRTKAIWMYIIPVILLIGFLLLFLIFFGLAMTSAGMMANMMG